MGIVFSHGAHLKLMELTTIYFYAYSPFLVKRKVR